MGLSRPPRGLVSTLPGPRVRGLTGGFIPPPPSGVGVCLVAPVHGFADSPVALFRHPLRGFGRFVMRVSTGSRTHPWLYSVTPFGGSDHSMRGATTGSRTHPWLYSATPFGVSEPRLSPSPTGSLSVHGFADSPVALFRYPLRGFGRFVMRVSTGLRTHPWLYSVTLRGFGRFVARVYTGSRTHPWPYSATPFGGFLAASFHSGSRKARRSTFPTALLGT
jgi:hypothetical protein